MRNVPDMTAERLRGTAYSGDGKARVVKKLLMRVHDVRQCVPRRDEPRESQNDRHRRSDWVCRA
jgi:hypothetical protein